MKTGLGKHVNNVMQAVFYYLSKAVPQDKAIEILKNDIAKTYKHKGEKVIEMNYKAVDEALSNLIRIEVKPEWINLSNDSETRMDKKRKNFDEIPVVVTDLMDKMLSLESD